MKSSTSSLREDLFSFLDAEIASKNSLKVVIDFNGFCRQHNIFDIDDILPFIKSYILQRRWTTNTFCNVFVITVVYKTTVMEFLV